MSFGQWTYRWRWGVVAAWVALAGALWAFVPPWDPVRDEHPTFLPPDAPYVRAVEALNASFPDNSGLSQAVVVFERPDGPLTPHDLATLERLADRIPRERTDQVTPPELQNLHIRSPRSVPLPSNPLLSPVGPRGQAGLIVVNIPSHFVSMRSARVVRHIRTLLGQTDLPAGVRVEVTGAAAFGNDYAEAGVRSNRRAFLVTLLAVVAILLLVYRAPLAALVPLGAITLAAAVAIKLVDAEQFWGVNVGTAERIFVIVLLYGAGVDYSLILISRYREFRTAGLDHAPAVHTALDHVRRAVFASAATDIAGLFMFSFAEFRVFRTAGPAVAIGLATALAAAVTLVPALMSLFGQRMFWPWRAEGTRDATPADAAQTADGSAAHRGGRGDRRTEEESGKQATASLRSPRSPRYNVILKPSSRARTPLWQRLGELVTRRPVTVIAVTLLLFALPVLQGTRITRAYDTLADLSEDYGAVRGANLVRRHWPIGQIGPATVLVRSDAPRTLDAWAALARRITDALVAADGVAEVRSLAAPLGTDTPVRPNVLRHLSHLLPLPDLDTAIRRHAAAEYVSPDRTAMRVVATFHAPPLTLQAMGILDRVERRTQEVLAAAPPPPANGGTAGAATGEGPALDASFSGATAQMANVRAVTLRDFRRVTLLALAVVFVLILLTLREPVLTGIMIGGTLLSFFASLGISSWVFVDLLGSDGLDWKVEVFLLIVMLAVGVDYSILLTARIQEELRTLPPGPAIRRAVLHTGPVISSCGIIMAATLGSLMSGELRLMQQLGFALALGMLLDTFLSRPLLLPAFATLLKARRTAAVPSSPSSHASPARMSRGERE